jgi:hypothetical protein
MLALARFLGRARQAKAMARSAPTAPKRSARDPAARQPHPPSSVELDGAAVGMHAPLSHERPVAQWLSSSQLARQALASQA